jgi:hypothetical protein
MSGYSQKVARLNKAADIKNLGVRLGRFCISNDIPVSDVMEFLMFLSRLCTTGSPEPIYQAKITRNSYQLS